MIERTPKAKEARKYFLECERRLMEIEGAAGLPKTTLPATTKKKTIINANIVITYNTGETTVKSATPVNINKVLAHLAPKWLMVDMALANRRMGPVRELMAHTMNMYGDMTEALNERQRVMG